MSILDLKKGERAIIIDITHTPDIKTRLNELGVVTGVKITLKRIGPFSSTLELEVGNFYLAIRKSIASKIIVRKI